MTNTFIPTLGRQLYCVWVKTGNPAHPLDRVWIDPELRSFVHIEPATPIRAQAAKEYLLRELPTEPPWSGK
jgi:hypothetical protein